MAGDPDEDALRRDVSPGRTGSRAGSSSPSQPQEGHVGGQPIPEQNLSAVPTHESKEARNATESMPLPPKNSNGPKSVSWAKVAARGTPAEASSIGGASQSKTPSRAANTTAMRHPSSGRVAPPAPAQVGEIPEQDTTSMPPSRNPSVSGQGDSGPPAVATPPPPPDSSAMEDDSSTEPAAEQERLREMKSYLRELAETHNLPHTLVEHLSDEESEATLRTVDALFKDFASRLSEECSNREKNLQSTKLKLEMSTSTQATLEKEKSALEETTKTKDAELEALGSNVQDLESKVKTCVTERDEAISQLRELRKELDAAEHERNEKEIEMQELNFALQRARENSHQAAPSADVEDLKTTIDGLREELRDLKNDKAELEMQAESTTAAQKRKINEKDAEMARQDEDLMREQKKNEKYESLIQELRHEKEVLLRKASVAEAEREPNFRVNNEIMPRDKYEKLLDNARGDVAKLREQLQQAEEERERVLQDELSLDKVREMIMEEIMPVYELATAEAAHNLFNTWEAEDARLLALTGENGYRKYLHAVVEPDRQISQTSSEAFIARGETAADIGLYGSQSSETASSPVRHGLGSELNASSRGSSIATEGSLMGPGDGSAELVKELDECRTRRKEAEERVEELKCETEKQKDEMREFQDEIRKLKEAAEATKNSVDGSAELHKALDKCQTRLKEAEQRIKELKDETKKQQDEIQESQYEIWKLKDAAKISGNSSAKLRGALDECQIQRDKAEQILKELGGKTKDQQYEIKQLRDEILTLKEAAETSKGSSEEPNASKCRVQTPTQAMPEHEDADKQEQQQLQAASAVALRDMQADLNECQAHRQQADKEIEELQAEAGRRSRELRKLKDKLALQQRVDELLEEQIGAAQAEASKAEAEARWAEARVVLQGEDEEADSGSTDGPEGYLKLVSTLSQRVEEAESQLGKAHRELADFRSMAAALQATIEHLEERRGQLQQERQQLWEDSKARRQPGQANTASEEALGNNKELRSIDEDIEETDEEIQQTKEELEKKNKELREKKKALDDCRSHGEELMEQIHALAEHRDGESEGDDSQEDDRQQEIDRLEEQVADLQWKVKAAEFKASSEAERRRQVEDKGVWEGTRAAALKSKETELDNLRKEYDEMVKVNRAEVDGLKKSLQERVDVENTAELGRITFEHRQNVDELEARLKAAEEKSRGHASEMDGIKSDHGKAMDEVKSKLDASDAMLRILQDRLRAVPDAESSPLETKPCDAATQTDGRPHEETTTPTGDESHGPLRAYLNAYYEFKKSMESGLRLQDTATDLQDYQLKIVDRLDQELARRIGLSRCTRASSPKTPSSTETPNSPETPDPHDTPDSPPVDAARPSTPRDQVSDSSTTASESDTDEEDERATTLRGIRETCEEFEGLIQRKKQFLDDEASAIQLLVALEAEIEALKKRLNGVEGSGGEEETPTREEHTKEAAGAESGDDDDSEDDERDPGKDPVEIRRRIARLRKKVNKTTMDLKKDKEALRSDIEEHEADLAEWIGDLDDLDNDPERTLYRYLANGSWQAALAGYWKGSTYIRPIPLPPMSVLQTMMQRPRDARREKLRVDGFPELDEFIYDGEFDQPPAPQRPQEALVRLIQKKLGDLRSYTDACEDDLERIDRVMEDLVPVDDPVARGRARNRRPMFPSLSRAATLDEGGAEGGEGEGQDRRDIVYGDLTSEPSSITSGNVFSDDGNPNRILRSVIPETVHDALNDWKKKTTKMLDKMETLQSDVEGLIDTGVNSRNYDCLRGRIRRLRKDLAEASATNASLRARVPGGAVPETDNELRELVRELRHANNSLHGELHLAKGAILDKPAQDERLRQLEKDLVAARAWTEAERAKNKTLAGEKERLEKTVERMEKLRDEAIQDGLDREMRETLYDYEELKKEAAGLKREAASLREKLSNEFLTRSAQLDTAQIVIQGMAGRLGEADRRVEVAEDMRATLVTGIERALDIDAEDDTKSLERTRRLISNILGRVPEEAGSQSGNDVGDKKGEDDDEYERATDQYNPSTGREHELIREILDERRKRAEDVAAANKTHEERAGRRRAEHEKQVKDWQAMHDAAEKARQLSESNLIGALERIRVLEVDAGWLRQMNGALDERLREECTANQEMSEELYGPSDADDGDGEDGSGGGGGGEGGGGGSGTTDAGRKREGVEDVGRKPRRRSRGSRERPGGAAGSDPDDDPGDDPGDDDSRNGGGSDGSDSTVRGGGRCGCPCVGLCDTPENPVFDGLPAGAQDIFRNLSKVYREYRSCCGRGDPGGAAEGTAAKEADEEDDGLLLWRLLGVMRGDADIREQMRNEGRHYGARLGLAFRGCAWVHALSWWQTAAYGLQGLAYLVAFFLPEGRWKPGPPGRAPPPKRVAIVVKDGLLLYLLYYTYRVLAATWAVQGVWEMANGYTRAYFIERGLHPERSSWLGLPGVDMRLPGFLSESGAAPYSTAAGWWEGRS